MERVAELVIAIITLINTILLIRSHKAIEQVHVSLNSRLSEWMRDMQVAKSEGIASAFAQGKAEGNDKS